MPNFKVDTSMFLTHVSFDIHHVRNFGNKEGYRRFKEGLLHRLERNMMATVFVLPEGFDEVRKVMI